MLSEAIAQAERPAVRVARRRPVAVRFPVISRSLAPAQRQAVAQLVLGRRCRRRAVR